MSDFLSEEEQVEAIKKWLKENGTFWLMAVCFVLLAVVAHKYYLRYQGEKLQNIAAAYEKNSNDWMQVMESIYTQQDEPKVRIKAQILQSSEGLDEEESLEKARTLVRAEMTESAMKLMNTNSKTAYAQFTAMSLATLAATENNLAEAEQHLQWSLKNNRDKALEPLIRLRLARVQMGAAKYDEAHALLTAKAPKAFDSLYNEALGDLYVLKSDKSEARKYYRLALDNMDADNLLSPQLKVKLSNLGERV